MADVATIDPSKLDSRHIPPVPVSTEELLRLIAERDREALKCLYDRFGGRMLALLNLATGSASLSEDLLVEIFVVIWKSAHRFDGENACAFHWLFSTMRGVVQDRTDITQTAFDRQVAGGITWVDV